MKNNHKKGKVTLLICTLMIIIVTIILFTNTVNANAYKQIELTISEMDKHIAASLNTEGKYYVNGLPLALSSNPYDYIINNTEYDKLVAMGEEAIKALEEALQNSDKYTSLDRYILAVAIEDIAKIDLKKTEKYMWQDADSFYSSWSKLKEDVLTEVPLVIGNESLSEVEKKKEILKYGVLAIDPLESIQNQLSAIDFKENTNDLGGFITNLIAFLSTADRNAIVKEASS